MATLRREDIADELEFGPLSGDDLAGISELITGMSYAEGDQRLRDKSAAYYEWMYLENPARRSSTQRVIAAESWRRSQSHPRSSRSVASGS